MIFITLGSQKFQFNRLLKAADELVANKIITEEIFAQIGYSDYKPQHYQYKDFLNREEYAKAEEKADIVITHGGTGAIIGALKKGKKVIAVPRLAKYGEHVDDHQVQLLKQFEEANLIVVCHDLNNLGEIYKEIPNKAFTQYKSNQMAIVNDIEKYILNDQSSKD